MSHALRLHDGTGEIAVDPSAGILMAYGTSVPAANAVGYAPGCKFILVNAVTIGTTGYVNIGTKAAANFVAEGLSGAIHVAYVYGDSTPIDAPFFIADRAYTVQSIRGRVLVAGTDAGAVTAQVRKAGSGTAIASGAVLHSGTLNLKGTVDTNQALTLTAANVSIGDGQAIGLDVTGTTTAAIGVVSVLLTPA